MPPATLARMVLAAVAICVPVASGCGRSAPKPPLSPVVSTPAPERSLPSPILRADALVRGGDPVAAVEAYAAYAAQNPADPLPWVRIGTTLRDHGQFSDAIEALSKAKERENGVTDTDSLLADAVLGAGRIDDAMRMARAVLAERPGDAVALRVAADASQARGLFQEQIAALETLVKVHPESADGWLALGRALFGAKRLARLAEVGDRLRLLEPKRYEGHLWAAHAAAILDSDDRLAPATEKAREAVALAPKSYLAHLTLGRLLRRQRAWAESARELETAAPLAGVHFEHFAELTMVYAAQRREADRRRARDAYQAGLRRQTTFEALCRDARNRPDDLGLQLKTIDLAQRRSDPRTASEAIERALRLAPNDPRVRAAYDRVRASYRDAGR